MKRRFYLVFVLLLVGACASSGPSEDGDSDSAPVRIAPEDVERISVQDAHANVQAGKALLVCAYADEEKCKRLAIEGSITYGTFQQRASSLDRNMEVIFYCG